jgi:hypothetical protein
MCTSVSIRQVEYLQLGFEEDGEEQSSWRGLELRDLKQWGMLLWITSSEMESSAMYSTACHSNVRHLGAGLRCHGWLMACPRDPCPPSRSAEHEHPHGQSSPCPLVGTQVLATPAAAAAAAARANSKRPFLKSSGSSTIEDSVAKLAACRCKRREPCMIKDRQCCPSSCGLVTESLRAFRSPFASTSIDHGWLPDSLA